MGQLRFGMLSFPTAPYDALARTWRDAEALGFDSAWLADDLNLPGIADFEPWTLLGALAHETTHLRIGATVWQNKFSSSIGSWVASPSAMSVGTIGR